jgi:cellobiose-specific phosphotransferase system component IIA
MTDTKPEALRLADELEFSSFYSTVHDAAAELRRLHEVNAELVEALNKITLVQNENPVIMYQAMEDIARAAIAKAEVTK